MATRKSLARPLIRLGEANSNRLVAAARDAAPVSGLTHNYYRYPARFSPSLVRAAIEAFTDPGDLVFDPFVGGGTTLVEALAAGRNGVGTDISALAAFVSEVKTTLYDPSEIAMLRRWARRIHGCIDTRAPAVAHTWYDDAGYLRHLGSPTTWRLRKAICQALSHAERLPTKRLEQFARCAVLRTAQWAMDGRRVLPTLPEFREKLADFVAEMLDGASELSAAAADSNVAVSCLHRPTAGMEQESIFLEGRRPRLVITSPPYPGVHVLYHRWQIHGGKETPAPFWIADRRDGDGAAYYTMGDRNTHAVSRYFTELRAALGSVAAVCGPETTVIQVVAFSDPDWQLPRYLSVADDVGFEEYFLARRSDATSGRRLWRSVPNRKWYASQRGHTSGSQEVVLFHRLRSAT